MAKGGSSGAGFTPAATPSGNTGSGLVGGIKPTAVAAPKPVSITAAKGHPGSTHTGTESSRTGALVATAKGEFSGWEPKPNDITGIRQTKGGSSLSNEKKGDIKGIKIETPIETRSTFDYMQPGQMMERSATKAEQVSGEGEQKLPGGHDPGLTPEQLAGMLTNRRALLEAVHKFGRKGLDGTPYYVQLQELNKQLGLGENDMDGYSIGGGE